MAQEFPSITGCMLGYGIWNKEPDQHWKYAGVRYCLIKIKTSLIEYSMLFLLWKLFTYVSTYKWSMYSMKCISQFTWPNALDYTQNYACYLRCLFMQFFLKMLLQTFTTSNIPLSRDNFYLFRSNVLDCTSTNVWSDLT